MGRLWLAESKSGGHLKWTEFDGEKLNGAYKENLIEPGIADRRKINVFPKIENSLGDNSAP